jgi:hypothetical protein
MAWEAERHAIWSAAAEVLGRPLDDRYQQVFGKIRLGAARERVTEVAASVVTLIAERIGSPFIGRPRLSGVRDYPEPVAGLIIARFVEYGAGHLAREYIRDLLEEGATWQEIADVGGFAHPGEAFAVATAEPWMDPRTKRWRDDGSFGWTCAVCDQLIDDYGPMAQVALGHDTACPHRAAGPMPLPSVAAARAAEVEAQVRAISAIRTARRNGHSWDEIALTLAVGDPNDSAGRMLAAYEYAGGDLHWDCPGCEQMITDTGPEGGEHGHAPGCSRVSSAR